MTYILSAVQRWECPNCEIKDDTQVKAGESRMHCCAGLRGLIAPMVPAGTKCKAEAEEWQDYVGDDSTVRHDSEGRPIASVKVTREDGEDVAVFPQTAQIRMEI